MFTVTKTEDFRDYVRSHTAANQLIDPDELVGGLFNLVGITKDEVESLVLGQVALARRQENIWWPKKVAKLANVLLSDEWIKEHIHPSHVAKKITMVDYVASKPSDYRKEENPSLPSSSTGAAGKSRLSLSALKPDVSYRDALVRPRPVEVRMEIDFPPLPSASGGVDPNGSRQTGGSPKTHKPVGSPKTRHPGGSPKPRQPVGSPKNKGKKPDPKGSVTIPAKTVGPKRSKQTGTVSQTATTVSRSVDPNGSKGSAKPLTVSTGCIVIDSGSESEQDMEVDPSSLKTEGESVVPVVQKPPDTGLPSSIMPEVRQLPVFPGPSGNSVSAAQAKKRRLDLQVTLDLEGRRVGQPVGSQAGNQPQARPKPVGSQVGGQPQVKPKSGGSSQVGKVLRPQDKNKPESRKQFKSRVYWASQKKGGPVGTGKAGAGQSKAFQQPNKSSTQPGSQKTTGQSTCGKRRMDQPKAGTSQQPPQAGSSQGTREKLVATRKQQSGSACRKKYYTCVITGCNTRTSFRKQHMLEEHVPFIFDESLLMIFVLSAIVR